MGERLVVPLKFAIIGKLLFFHDFQRLVVNIQASFIRVRLCIAHSRTPKSSYAMIFLDKNFIHIPSPKETPFILRVSDRSGGGKGNMDRLTMDAAGESQSCWEGNGKAASKFFQLPIRHSKA